jgi:hypothetical protein
MLLLMRQLTEARSSHNSKVLAMRQRKRDLVVQLNTKRTRLAELDKLLGGTGMHVRAAVCHGMGQRETPLGWAAACPGRAYVCIKSS